jgi:hypothetical protein
MKKISVFYFLFQCCILSVLAQTNVIWKIGKEDGRGAEFALAPVSYKDFVATFGGENTTYYIGYSNPQQHWPYVLPGPLDDWAGGGYWSGFYPRHFPRIFFNLANAPSPATLKLAFSRTSDKHPPLIRIEVNGHREEKQLQPGDGTLITDTSAGKQLQLITIHVPAEWLKPGLNEIRLGSMKGSWAVFDYIALESDQLLQPGPASASLVLSARAADFEYPGSPQRVQPLLIDVWQLDTTRTLDIRINDLPPVTKQVEKGHSILEIPMPATPASVGNRIRNVTIRSGAQTVYTGAVTCSAKPLHTKADYVDLLMGTGNSRWMFKPGPSLPLSMVQIAPDNQDQTWKAGYEYTIDNIMGFSHFSDWTMCGLLMMPTGGPLQVNPGRENQPDSGYRSRIDKQSECARVGKYSVFMTDTRIQADITSTRRAALQRYTFPQMDSARILVDLFTPNE